MKLQTPFDKKLADCPRPGEGVHAWILGAANVAALTGVSREEAAKRIVEKMPRAETPHGEVDAAIEKAFSENGGGGVSMYRGVKDNAGTVAPLVEILAGIQSGQWAELVRTVRNADTPEARAAKACLPGFTTGGVFERRKADRLKRHSGFLILDVDKLPSVHDAEATRDQLGDDVHTLASFVSPSGLGAKAVIAIDRPKDAEEHKAAFRAVVEYWRERGVEADTSGQDVSRLCFVSHDEHAIVKDTAAPFKWRDAEAAAEPKPYTTRAWDELARLILEPPEIVWAGWTLGALCVFFGVGGLGKSRLALDLARCQVLGWQFAGMDTAPRPLKHLFVGSENSIHRLQHDVRKMSGGLTPAQMALLGDHIRLATLEAFDDVNIAMTANNEGKWRATLEAFPPDVLWVDPFGDVLDGEANADDAIRSTLGNLRRLLRKVSPNAGLGVLAHSRTGAGNLLQAVGYDASNFGKGSKALFSAARVVWNLAPGDDGDDPPVVCVQAKSNDAQRVAPFAVRLDHDTMTYCRDDGFDFTAWQEDLAYQARGRRGQKKAATLSAEEATEALGGEAYTSAEVVQKLRGAGATRDHAKDLIRKLTLDGVWETWRPPVKNPPVFVGLPGAIKAKQAEVRERLQGRLPT